MQFSQILKYHYSKNKQKLQFKREGKLGHVILCICVLEFWSKTEHNIPWLDSSWLKEQEIMYK
jgi:hypothetical protein